MVVSKSFSDTCPFGSTRSNLPAGFIALYISEKNPAASGTSCTTAEARAKSIFSLILSRPRESSLHITVSIRPDSPALAARFSSDRIIFSWTSTHITLPFGPTIRARGRLKKPIAQPISATVIASFTYGLRILLGFWNNFLVGLASR